MDLANRTTFRVRIDLVLDELQDRGHGSDTNTSGPKQDGVELEDVFGSSTERTIDLEDGSTVRSGSDTTLDQTELSVRVEQVVQSTGPVTSVLNVHAQKVLVRARGDGEWMPLLAGNVRAVNEDVLARLKRVKLAHVSMSKIVAGSTYDVVERFFLDTQLNDTGGVSNSLGNNSVLRASVTHVRA